MQEDANIHRRLLARDPAVLDDLVGRHGSDMDRLASLILGRLGTQEDAEEVVSDALVAAWQQAPAFDPTRSTLKSWLLMLTKYAALDRRRAMQRSRFTPQGDEKVLPLEAAPEPLAPDTPEEELLRSHRNQELWQALDLLPDQERDLLIRRYFIEESVMELAESLGLSRGALDNRLWRARQALKALLHDERRERYHGQPAI